MRCFLLVLCLFSSVCFANHHSSTFTATASIPKACTTRFVTGDTLRINTNYQGTVEIEVNSNEDKTWTMETNTGSYQVRTNQSLMINSVDYETKIKIVDLATSSHATVKITCV